MHHADDLNGLPERAGARSRRSGGRTLPIDRDDATDRRSAVLDSLVAAVSDPRSRLRVVATLRADFYDRPLGYGGFGELMRLKGREATPLAVLSRSLAGTRGKVLIINLPGSPKGAVESLDAIVELVPHVLELLRGRTEHA